MDEITFSEFFEHIKIENLFSLYKILQIKSRLPDSLENSFAKIFINNEKYKCFLLLQPLNSDGKWRRFLKNVSINVNENPQENELISIALKIFKFRYTMDGEKFNGQKFREEQQFIEYLSSISETIDDMLKNILKENHTNPNYYDRILFLVRIISVIKDEYYYLDGNKEPKFPSMIKFLNYPVGSIKIELLAKTYLIEFKNEYNFDEVEWNQLSQMIGTNYVKEYHLNAIYMDYITQYCTIQNLKFDFDGIYNEMIEISKAALKPVNIAKLIEIVSKLNHAKFGSIKKLSKIIRILKENEFNKNVSNEKDKIIQLNDLMIDLCPKLKLQKLRIKFLLKNAELYLEKFQNNDENAREHFTNIMKTISDGLSMNDLTHKVISILK